MRRGDLQLGLGLGDSRSLWIHNSASAAEDGDRHTNDEIGEDDDADEVDEVGEGTMFICELVSLTTLGWVGSGVVCKEAFRALCNTCGPVFSAIALLPGRLAAARWSKWRGPARLNATAYTCLRENSAPAGSST